MGESSAPDRFDTEPIIGWRYWYAYKSGGRYVLVSPMLAGFEWPSTEKAVARCSAHTESAPQVECGCGIHAAASLAQVAIPVSSFATIVVVGQVSLWGRIAEHELGWRGQYAYPYSLQVKPTMPRTFDWAREIARDLAAVYAVDVEVKYPDANRRPGSIPRDRDHSGE